MITLRNTAIAAIAAVTIAASMASPANAWSKKGWALGLGLGTMAAIGAAHAYGGYGYGHRYYGEGRYYNRIARKCAYRYGWHTWKFERCMDRHGL